MEDSRARFNRGHNSAPSHPESKNFRAMLAELEAGGVLVDLCTEDGGLTTGRVTVVATDHLVVVDIRGAETYLPIEKVVLAIIDVEQRRESPPFG